MHFPRSPVLRGNDSPPSAVRFTATARISGLGLGTGAWRLAGGYAHYASWWLWRRQWRSFSWCGGKFLTGTPPPIISPHPFLQQRQAHPDGKMDLADPGDVTRAYVCSIEMDGRELKRPAIHGTI